MTTARAALPQAAPRREEHFAAAMTAVALCADVAAVAGSGPARMFVNAASGALRHALACLACERPAPSAIGDFDMRRIGSSELVGAAGEWDTVVRCALPDGATGTVRALWPASDAQRGVWLRPDPALRGLWTRGRLELGADCARFVDEAAAEARPVPSGGPDLGRDLVREGPIDLSRTPALAAALEMSLVAGSWLHLGTGRRWWADVPTARAIVRMMGCPMPPPAAARSLPYGMVDRGALLLIERLGWRHVPLPSALG